MEVIARDVLARLEGALEDVSGRDEKLRSLFQDVVHPIEEYLDVEPEWKKYSLYYEALSHYLEKDEMGHALAEEIMPIITALWDTADVRNTFTLLMHRWILRQTGDICRSLNVITKGANALFWWDLLTHQMRFQPVFAFLAEILTSRKESNLTIDGNNYVYLVRLASRFSCYYELPSECARLKDLAVFATEMEQSAWWSRCVGPDEDISGAASMLVMELAHQLEHIRSEEVLGEHLLRMHTLSPLVPGALEISARIRLENILHQLGTPGGPLYPPRGIRTRARNLTDKLFPKGRHGRRIVHLSFRLVNPYRWPMSLAHYLCISLPSTAFQWTVDHAPSPIASYLTAGAARLSSVVQRRRAPKQSTGRIDG